MLWPVQVGVKIAITIEGLCKILIYLIMLVVNSFPQVHLPLSPYSSDLDSACISSNFISSIAS